MMIWTFRQAAAVAASLASILLAVEPIGATVLPQPKFSVVFAQPLCNYPPLYCARPGSSAALDVTQTNGFAELADARASGHGPVASVQGETHNGMGPNGVIGGAKAAAYAQADWFAVVTPVNAGLVLQVSRVPVTFQANAEASATGDSAVAWAGAGSPFGTVSFCASTGGPGFCSGISNSVGLTTLTGFVAPNTQIEFSVTANGGALRNSNFQASADPVFSIANALIPGTDINFRDAFAVSFSAGVTQSLNPQVTPVPEPGTQHLIAWGLAGLLAWRAIQGRGAFR